jgi:uncharacterized repeat protein (TIGR03806 family)
VLAALLLPWAPACDDAGPHPLDAGDHDMDATTPDGGPHHPGNDAGPGSDDAGADAAVPDWGIDKRPRNETCVAPQKPGLPGVATERAFAAIEFDHPVGMFQLRSDDQHLYVIEQSTGKVKRFPSQPDVKPSDVQVMLTLKVVEPDYEGDEIGLLGLAFDPEFASNGHAYVFYNPREGALRSTIERYTLSADKKRFDPASKLTILEVKQPYHNHKGGNIAFGPDGNLYIGFGDGGGGDDQHCFALDPQIPLGKFFRIDVRGASKDAPYAIPSDNPYAQGGGLPEIYALGVRNPWRWSFDRETGALWAGDVGQNEFEEVDRIERGKNYGWKVKEGKSCFADRTCVESELYHDRKPPELPACDAPGFTDPVWDYGRNEGAVVTGGYVYRGHKLPALVGRYVYGDFTNGRIWALDDSGGQVDNQLLVESGISLAAFGEDNQGELYAVDWEKGGIHALVARNAQGQGSLPTLLSATGCVDPAQPAEPLPAMIPYDVRVPFWSDGAHKQRWLALPDDTHMEIAADGDLELPPGSVALKRFDLAGKPFETRFFVRYADGSYGGYTYRWNADGKDATLLSDALDIEVSGQPWHYPSSAECVRCHHAVDGGHLGIELAQLDLDFDYQSGRRANQLRTLEHLGMLTLPGARPTPLARLDDTSASLEARARSYLHANCSQCHRTGGPGRGAMDMRFSAADPQLCDQAPLEGDLGIKGAFILSPGELEKSLLHVRMARRDDKGMPPLASARVDEAGLSIVDQWIQSLTTCD